MGKKVTRLQFTEDDLTDKAVRKAADRAEKAADKAEKAVNKASKPKGKLNSKPAASKARSSNPAEERTSLPVLPLRQLPPMHTGLCPSMRKIMSVSRLSTRAPQLSNPPPVPSTMPCTERSCGHTIRPRS